MMGDQNKGKAPATPTDPPSPSASYYDVSDDEEGGYNTIAHSKTGRGVKLLFSKSKVYVHPTPSAKNNIPGFIALVQQKSSPLSNERPASSQNPLSSKNDPSSYLLAWVPEASLTQDDLSSYVKVDMAEGTSPPRQTYLVPPLPISSAYHDSTVGSYAFSVPLSSIYSILVRPPSLGWWFGSVVVNLRSGSSLPALFFHDSECESTILQKKKRTKESFDPFGEAGDLFWGGDEVVRWLKRYVNVERSAADPSAYLIDPSDEDKIGFGQVRKSGESDRGQSGERRKSQAVEGSKQASPGPPGMDPLTKALKETRWKVLEQLSKITTFTRRTVEDVSNNKNLPPQLRRLLHNPEVQTLQDEFDSARLYLARWAMGIAEQSDRERNQRMWTAKEVMELEESSVGDFEILDMEAGRMPVGGENKRKPVNMTEWKSFFDIKTGKLQVTVDEVRERVFHGGLDPEDGVRKEAWLFLLGVYEWNSTATERHAYMSRKRDEFIRLKGAWWDRMIDGGASTEQEEWWKEQKGRIEKDVHRTDRHIPLFAGEDIPHPDPSSPFHNQHGNGTNVHMEQLKDMLLTYLEYDSPTSTHSTNPAPQNLGYVQGMSDLLSPLYAIFQDDAVAFWAFVAFMQRMARNFVRDQSGMRAQLATLDQLVQILDPRLYAHLQRADSTNFFFFFRMLLVWYKREFEWTDVLRLWETLWTDWLSSQFHLFLAVAILEKHRDVIMAHLQHFDEVLKYINELSGTIDLRDALIRAEGLFRRFERTVEAVDRKNAGLGTPSNMIVRPRKDSAAAAEAGKRKGNAPPTTATTSGSDTRPQQQQPGRATAEAMGVDAEAGAGADNIMVISPELRLLLSKKIITLDKLAEGGAGLNTSRTRASGLRD